MSQQLLTEKLSQLWLQGLELFLDDGKLGFKAPADLLQGENLEFIKQQKPQIIQLLTEKPELMQGFPVTQGQAAIYTAQVIDSHNPKFNLLACVLLKNTVDNVALQNSLNACLKQHSILSASFTLSPLATGNHESQQSFIRQTLNPNRGLALAEILLESEQENSAQNISTVARQWASRRFKLDDEVLIRAALIKQENGSSYLVLSCHHLVCDFIGLQNVLKNIQDLYQQQISNEVSVDISSTYNSSTDNSSTYNSTEIVDYKTHVLNELSQSHNKPAALSQLLTETMQETELSDINFSGFKPTLQTKPEHKQNKLQEKPENSPEHSFTLNQVLSDSLQKLVKQHNSSLFIWTASAFSILLSRLSLDRQFLLSTPLANRFGSQIYGAGHFTNPLPLVNDFKLSDVSFADITQHIKSQLSTLVKSQDYPAELLQQHFNYACNTALSFNKLDDTAFEGVLFKQLILAEQLSFTHDLVLTGLQQADKLTFSFRYNPALISSVGAKRLEQLLLDILQLSIDKDPSDLWPTQSCLLTEQEHKTLYKINNQSIDYPNQNLAAQFFQQAEKIPENIALTIPASVINSLKHSKVNSTECTKAQQFEYAEIAKLAKNFQHWISQQHLSEDSNSAVGIAIYGERDQFYLAITLASLALGFTVTPIDTQFPAERIGHMLALSKSQLVFNTSARAHPFTESQLESNSTKNIATWVNIFDECLPQFSNQNISQLQSKITAPESINYIFFTSGSTGLPKAVPVSQAAVCRLSHYNQFFSVEEKQACLFSSNISFDATNIEIWQTLLHGGELVAVNKDILLAPLDLVTIFEQHNVQHLFFTTALFNTLIAHKPSVFKHFISVLFGGEACDNHAIQACLEQGKPEHLMHLYGPTENGSISTYHEITQENFDSQQTTSIGSATGNTSSWVVDQFNNLQVPGAVGELLVGGDAVSTAYLGEGIIPNLKKLNQEKFIRDNFAAKPSLTQRLYRSGDLVYNDNECQLYFVGRSDDQIKIRGFRIQLTEIEQQLLNIDGIKYGTVVAHKHENNTQLIAYCVLKNSAEIKTNDIKQVLNSVLPAYMVPQHILILESFPLNPNGKIDKRKLPLPSESKQSINILSSNDSDLSTTEQQVLKQWLTFDLAVSSPDDNFFEVGGNSLLAVRLCSSLSDSFTAKKKEKSTLNLQAKDLFEHASIRSLSAYIEQQLTKENTVENFNSLYIKPRNNDLSDNNQFKASLSQQRLWFVQELQKDSHVYNMPLVLKLDDSLRAIVNADTKNNALTLALNTVIKKHKILQASFIDNQGTAAIQINPDCAIEIERINVNSNDELQEAITQFSQRVFTLNQAPLFSVTVLNNSHHSYLALNLHHIIADGWSAQLLLKDIYLILSQTSNSTQENNRIESQQSAIDYFDFAAWQLSNEAQSLFAKELLFWQETLADAPSGLNLPLDKIRPSTPTGSGGKVEISFNEAETACIKLKAKNSKISLFSLLAASYQLLLSRYCNQKDICIGFPVHGRDNAQTHNIVGLFVNNLVLRQQFTAETCLDDLLSNAAKQTQLALAHQNLPFDKLLENLNIEKNLSFIPLLQASFSCEEQSLQQLIQHSFNAQASLIDNHWQVAKYDLHLSCFAENNLTAELEYNADIFQHRSMQEWADNFKRLCLALCQADNHSSVANLSFLSAQDIQQQTSNITGFNASEWLYPEYKAISGKENTTPYLHEFFEAQVNSLPQQIAVSDTSTTLTYSELNAQSNRLAEYLRQHGVGINDTVATLLDRSVNMSIILLAILKTGANYTPLLSDMPAERMQFILQETQAKLLICSLEAESQFEIDTISHQLNDIKIIDLNSQTLQQELLSFDENNKSLALDLNKYTSLFNIIYTSGSTGQPKGVMVTQAGIINRLLWMQRYTKLTTNDKILQKTPYNFDVSGWELFWPLITGASLHFMQSDAHKDPSAIAQAITNYGITTAHFVPSMLQAFNSTEGMQQCINLKRVFTSGEALQTHQSNDLLNALPNTELHNLYGPTEAAIDVSYYACQANSQLSSIPIGKTIDNIRLYILDSNQQLLPIGAIGDLYISGIGLAQGYLNRAELTAETFIRNPYQLAGDDESYSRIYKTGDIARYQDDGNIEYLGRSDNQVKLRGLRIELGEIENGLLAIDAIEQAVALVQNLHGEPQLVAYYVKGSPQEALDDTDIRQALAKTLPSYMLPFCFIPLENLPLSANGKLDRKQLPLAENLLQSSTEFVAAENETEEVVAQFFSQILSIDKVGRHDNFFLLGGHSLLATRLAANIRSHFECPFELKQIFDRPTVEGISLAIIEQNMLQLGMQDIDDDDLLALLDEI